MKHLVPVYTRQPVGFTHGKGCWLWDDEGKRYLDALAGIAVTGLGHSHPAVVEVIQDQSARLLHTTNMYQIESQRKLADTLCSATGMEQAFFCNSGLEANEMAIKTARLFAQKKGVDAPAIIVAEHAFHGRSLATLSASGNRVIQAGFEPLVTGFVRVPYNDIEAIERVLSANKNVVAVMIEPILGEGGIVIPDEGYLAQIRQLTKDHDALMILDEIQTGNGRTGKFCAYQHENILPDVLTLAKGLGNGIPIGSCLVSQAALELYHPGNHGSTFGGNPFACSVAQVVVDVLFKEDLVTKSEQKGDYLCNKLLQMLGDKSILKCIRHKGLMMGVVLEVECTQLVGRCLSKGLLINVTQGHVIRLLPPLTISEEELDTVAQLLSNEIIKLESEQS